MKRTEEAIEIAAVNRESTLPLLRPTIGPPAIDLQTLHAKTGCAAFDPGAAQTANCRSAITYVDGEKGILLYRGYAIDALVENCSFLETAWLLLNGELPEASELAAFSSRIARHGTLPESLPLIARGFGGEAHPMAVMGALLYGLAGQYQEGLDIFDRDQRAEASHRLIGTIPTIAAVAHRHSRGEPFVPPRHDLGYAENFLAMLFSSPGGSYRAPEPAVRALEAVLIVQADHEQNASTSTMRLVGSTRANPYAAAAAALAALWGPLHGGANEAVLRTLEEIGSAARIPEILRRAKDKNDPFRLMGFGHRVYKSYDPRAKVLRRRAHELLAALGKEDDPLLELAMKLEKIALEDEYFIARKLYPNVDFYSGIIFRALGLPPQMFTPVFVLARMTGWAAHWNEMMADPETRIFRPRQLYTGPVERAFVPFAERPARAPAAA